MNSGKLYRRSAFTDDPRDGNPAGVWVGDTLHIDWQLLWWKTRLRARQRQRLGGISGIFKALEVSAGLALPKDAAICFKE